LCQLPPRLRRRYSVLFIYFLGVITNAPPITAEKIASVAKIPMVNKYYGSVFAIGTPIKRVISVPNTRVVAV